MNYRPNRCNKVNTEVPDGRVELRGDFTLQWREWNALRGLLIGLRALQRKPVLIFNALTQGQIFFSQPPIVQPLFCISHGCAVQHGGFDLIHHHLARQHYAQVVHVALLNCQCVERTVRAQFRIDGTHAAGLADVPRHDVFAERCPCDEEVSDPRNGHQQGSGCSGQPQPVDRHLPPFFVGLFLAQDQAVALEPAFAKVVELCHCWEQISRNTQKGIVWSPRLE